MYHYQASGQTVRHALMLLIERHTHTRTPISISSSSLPLSRNNEEHKGVSRGLESVIMTKPCCKTSTRVAIVAQQRQQK